jgi:hypothetical protein
MISPEERDSLIKYRLHQAFDTTELADFLIKSGKLNVGLYLHNPIPDRKHYQSGRIFRIGFE